MQTKTDRSYGVIAVKKDSTGNWLFLLIEQHDKRGGTFWAFPKGHPENDETPEAAARRELAEEVGLSKVELDTDHPFEQKYTFKWHDTLVHKSVTYFLGYAEEEPLQPQEKEIANAAWLTESEAREQLTHQNTRDLLTEVTQYLQTK